MIEIQRKVVHRMVEVPSKGDVGESRREMVNRKVERGSEGEVSNGGGE